MGSADKGAGEKQCIDGNDGQREGQATQNDNTTQDQSDNRIKKTWKISTHQHPSLQLIHLPARARKHEPSRMEGKDG